MPHFEPVVFAIAVAALVVALSALARRLPVPTPILQVTAGFLVALVPGVTTPDLRPEVVFFVFLPPILWAAAMFTSVREFKRNIGPISGLAIGLVLVTTLAVAVAARALMPGLPWALAIALGAIVSPPDAVAATAIVSRLPVPRRVITVLEGESLVNDATALVIYRTAVAAAVTGSFSWGESIVRFFIDAGVGSLIGLLVSWLVLQAIRWTKDGLAETLLTLAAPYVAWVSAESLHVSAVLACVAGGVYLQQHLSTAVGPSSRLQTRTIWDLVIFLVNAIIFLLLGTQLFRLLAFVPPGGLGRILLSGALITAVAVVVRLLWVPLASLIAARGGSTAPRRADARMTWKPLVLVSWTSMRGVISLATALALPRLLATGEPLPYRTEIILVAMCVIVLTLVTQGLTLAPLVQALRFAPESEHHDEERMARHEAARRGVEALEDLSHEEWADPRDVAALRDAALDRVRMIDESGGSFASRRRLRQGMIAAERRMLIRLRNEDAISDEVLRALEQELDLESVRAGGEDTA